MSEQSRCGGRRTGRTPRGCVAAGAGASGRGASPLGAGSRRDEGPSLSPTDAERLEEGDKGLGSGARGRQPGGVSAPA